MLNPALSVCCLTSRLCKQWAVTYSQRQTLKTTSIHLEKFTFDSASSGEPSAVKPDFDTESRVPVRPPLPLITSRSVQFPNPHVSPKQAWLENLDTLASEKLGIVDLHPDIFATYPRLDVLHKNVHWQQSYRKINYDFAMSRAEMRGSGRKLWPQKKTGRHRAASRRAPQWHKGGAAHGPRGPKSYFYMLSNSYRCLGLRVALSVKYAQSDLYIVDSLEIPTDDPEYIDDLVDTRFWGFSVLFVDDTDVMPRNISLALNERGHFNLMPVYGLNVYSMLKHETLVLTLAAVERLEERLLRQMHKQGVDLTSVPSVEPQPLRYDAGKVPYKA